MGAREKMRIWFGCSKVLKRDVQKVIKSRSIKSGKIYEKRLDKVKV